MIGQPMLKNVTGITVCFNTKDSMKRTHESVRKFCPSMPIIIINGSDANDSCTHYVESLMSDLTTVISLGRNIRHGQGMHMGINQAKTKYALIFDSDIEMIKSPVSQMLAMMEEDTFGIGSISKKGFDGHAYRATKSQHISTGYMLYLHPYFQLINISNYRKFHRYIHHGAPCYLTMRDIHKKGLSNKIIKEFPSLRSYVKHYGAITRKVERLKRLSSIEGSRENT